MLYVPTPLNSLGRLPTVVLLLSTRYNHVHGHSKSVLLLLLSVVLLYVAAIIAGTHIKFTKPWRVCESTCGGLHRIHKPGEISVYAEVMISSTSHQSYFLQ